MNYKRKAAELIKPHVELDITVIEDFIEIPPKPEMGDYAFPCFKLSKIMRKLPNTIAEELKNNIYSEEFEEVKNIGPYLNFFINKGVFLKSIIKKVLEEGNDYGASNIGEGKTVYIEYSSLNIAGAFHIEYLFATAIGNALYKMFRKEGYNVVCINHFRDLKSQFGNRISAYDRFEDKEILDNKKIDVVIQELREKGLLVKSNGIQVVNLKEYNLPPCMILNEDGLPMYAARNLAATVYRKRIYDFYKCIYIAGISENVYFKQLSKVLELAGYEWVKDYTHIWFGLVKFADRKLYTLNSSFVIIDELLRQAVEKTSELIKTKKEIKYKEETAETIGIGAIIFTYLRNLREKDIIFDLNEILSVEGDTFPYIQYVYSIGNNILAKTGECMKNADYSKLSSKEEFQLVKNLGNFNNIIMMAIDKLEPAILTRYVIDLAKTLNKFYSTNLGLNVKDESLKSVRVNLIKASLQVIKNGLELLGIDIVEKM